MTVTITLLAEPTFDGSGFNIEQIALDNTTGRPRINNNNSKKGLCVQNTKYTLWRTIHNYNLFIKLKNNTMETDT